MPIYEFECPDGDIFFEERLSLSQLDEVVVKCPTCYTPRVKKVISAHLSRQPRALQSIRR